MSMEKVYNDFWSVGLKSLHQFGDYRTIQNDYESEEDVTYRDTRPTKKLNEQDKQDQLQKAFSSWYMKGKLEKATKALEEYGEDSQEYIEYKKRFCGYVKKVASNYLSRYNKYNNEAKLDQRFIAGEAPTSYNEVEYKIDFERTLTTKELNIAKEKMAGYNHREIAQKLNTSRQSISRKLEKIREKMT